VREIAEFWFDYHFGKRLDDVLAERPEPKPRAPRQSKSKTSASIAPRSRTKPATPDAFAAKYPQLAEWIKHGGWIELGSNDGFSPSYARVLNAGGMIWEAEMADFDSVDAILEAMEAAVREAL
jgi:hypothetical protein